VLLLLLPPPELAGLPELEELAIPLEPAPGDPLLLPMPEPPLEPLVEGPPDDDPTDGRSPPEGGLLHPRGMERITLNVQKTGRRIGDSLTFMWIKAALRLIAFKQSRRETLRRQGGAKGLFEPRVNR
jgi:hypothetical protein